MTVSVGGFLANVSLTNVFTEFQYIWSAAALETIRGSTFQNPPPALKAGLRRAVRFGPRSQNIGAQ
jgi:hypothetical protein